MVLIIVEKLCDLPREIILFLKVYFLELSEDSSNTRFSLHLL